MVVGPQNLEQIVLSGGRNRGMSRRYNWATGSVGIIRARPRPVQLAG
ncbi:MAG TPA: hypothetical protein VIS09_24760 [Streptomyces sp.]